MQKRSTRRTSKDRILHQPYHEHSEVVFALERADAKQVILSGDFNDWSRSSLPMIRRECGRWEKRLLLPKGRFEYKFIVDGTWIADPSTSRFVANAFGSTNSVIEIS